ncbi:unnamed protein product [Adineta steineri]|uniref:Carrier domain-containing protein n=1 Tax=Adineta steineri TaxID=433720 RepID=A0A815H7Q6_9BILA|nr:unnamed protein product [Adineta steineri]CAF1350697.1 unnamed protein product [Adineta steineri]
MAGGINEFCSEGEGALDYAADDDAEGVHSLAAVSLYNWLGQETGIYIPLVDLLQGLSIEKIATLVYNKLNEKE